MGLDSYTEPHLESAALVTIDIQCDVLDGQQLEVAGIGVALLDNEDLRERLTNLGPR